MHLVNDSCGLKGPVHMEVGGVTPGRVLPYERLIGMCRLMGSHFHDWIDYNGVAFSIEFTRMGSHIN